MPEEVQEQLFDQQEPTNEQGMEEQEQFFEQQSPNTGDSLSFGAVLYEWESFNDFGTERNLNWTASMVFFQLIFVLFSLITKQWFLVLLLLAIVAVTFLIARFPAKQVLNQITSLGIVIDGRTKKWSELKSFWIQQDIIHTILGFEPKGKFDLSEIVFIDGEDFNTIIDLISQYLPVEEKYTSLIEVVLDVLGFRIRQLVTQILNKFPLTKKPS